MTKRVTPDVVFVPGFLSREEADAYIVTAEGLPEWACTEAHVMDMEELKKAPKDRFVVPNDFEEFCAWKPDYILMWVKKRLNRFVVDDEVEDWAQELRTHLLTRAVARQSVELPP
jgi:hypothetical protein